jgi:GH35 family endo-1,4-beta-xylanase
VAVRDAGGFPVPGANVAVRMKRHAFGLGSAVDGGRLLGFYGTIADRQKYQAMITNWFNKVVLENDLKWPSWEANPSTAKSTLAWLTQRGVAVRGHNLIWPSAQFLPANVPPLYGDPAALRQRINQHFTDILTQVTGQCVEWDVINEPYSNHEVMDVLGVNEKIAWFKLARTLEPRAALFLNEYGNLEAAGLNSAQSNDFFKQLKFLRDGGAPLGGIGMQGHFSSFLSSPDNLLAMLDRFGTFGLPIEATEFDVDVPDETVQADYLRDFMTTLFSHPSVNGILMWGFWEVQHWRPNAALFRANWELKPNGVMWSNLVFREWWTTTNVVTDASGNATVRAFKGDYAVGVSTPGHSLESLTSLADNRTLTVVVPGTTSPPSLTAVVQGGQIRLSWPEIATGYHVEWTPTLVPAAWQSAGPDPTLADGEWHVAIDLAAGPGFFRLTR